MARVDEKQVAVARVYCRAILDLAQTKEQAEAMLEEMQGLLDLRDQNAAFRDFFDSPLRDPREREALLEKVLRGRASDLLVNSIQVMNANGRLGIFETIVEVYRTLYQERYGQIDVHVTTAVPLSDDLRQEIMAAASRMVGRQPNLVASVDESLIGGLVVRIGDRKIDTTVAKTLRTLRGTLSERASKEIYASRIAE